MDSLKLPSLQICCCFSVILDPQTLHVNISHVSSAWTSFDIVWTSHAVPAELGCLPTHCPPLLTVLSFLQQVLTLKMLSLFWDLFRTRAPLQLGFLERSYLPGTLLLIFLLRWLSMGIWAGAVL